MWSRVELKEKAKAVLKTNYWEAFGVSIVIALAGGNGGSGGSRGGNSYSSDTFSSLGIEWIAIILMIVLGAIAIALAIRIFAGYPLEVGGRRYFVKSAQYEDNKRCFRFAFQKDTYWGIVKTMLRKGIQNFLWYLVLIIPGCIKHYAYSMVPYILADNPNIGSEKAIKLSNDMTNGHKMNMFILDLSFLGWYLLGLLACCVGILFVMPYENATKAELYLVLRKNALESGLCSYDDLMLNNEQTDNGIGLL